MRREKICKLETNIDHLSGEELGAALLALNAMPEALDAIYITGMGKKNRPAGILEVICHPQDEEIVCMAIFRHTHTLGIRTQTMERLVLPREAGEAQILGEIVKVKNYDLENEKFSRPEADEICRISQKRNLGAPALRFMRRENVSPESRDK